MGNSLGSRERPSSPDVKERRGERARALLRRPRVIIKGRFASAEEVRGKLEQWLPENLDAIRALAMSAEDDRVRLDALRYLTDRRMGKPTERQQVEQVPVSYSALDDEQFRELAGRIRGDVARATNGESSENPDGDGVPVS